MTVIQWKDSVAFPLPGIEFLIFPPFPQHSPTGVDGGGSGACGENDDFR